MISEWCFIICWQIDTDISLSCLEHSPSIVLPYAWARCRVPDLISTLGLLLSCLSFLIVKCGYLIAPFWTWFATETTWSHAVIASGVLSFDTMTLASLGPVFLKEGKYGAAGKEKKRILQNMKVLTWGVLLFQLPSIILPVLHLIMETEAQMGKYLDRVSQRARDRCWLFRVFFWCSKYLWPIFFWGGVVRSFSGFLSTFHFFS